MGWHASRGSGYACPKTSEVCLIRRVSILNYPKRGHFSNHRPSNDLFAVTERMAMRAVSIVGLFQTHHLACGKVVRLVAICLMIASCIGCGKKGPQRAA